MFGIFRKDPVKVLNDEYTRLLEQARDLQRKGDIKGFAAMTAKADEVLKQVESHEKSNTAAKDR